MSGGMGCPLLGHMLVAATWVLLDLDSSPSALLSEAGWTQRTASLAALTEDPPVASQEHKAERRVAGWGGECRVAVWAAVTVTQRNVDEL